MGDSHGRSFRTACRCFRCAPCPWNTRVHPAALCCGRHSSGSPVLRGGGPTCGLRRQRFRLLGCGRGMLHCPDPLGSRRPFPGRRRPSRAPRARKFGCSTGDDRTLVDSMDADVDNRCIRCLYRPYRSHACARASACAFHRVHTPHRTQLGGGVGICMRRSPAAHMQLETTVPLSSSVLEEGCPSDHPVRPYEPIVEVDQRTLAAFPERCATFQ